MARLSLLMLLLCLLPVTGALGEPQPRETASDEDTLVLEGVIVASNPASSIALVKRVGDKRARPLRVGQKFAGFVLLEVKRDSALLQSYEGRIRLGLAGKAAPTTSVAEEPADAWIRHNYSKSATAKRFEKELPVILSETALSPRGEGGEIRGLTLTRLPDGTLLSESGLKLGDVILSINGEPLTGLDSLWELLARFKDDDELRVIVERRGAVVRLAYAFTN